ncbi:MAG: cupredoxin domain-containing protein [Thermomicrobiales bacterium]
MDRRRLLTTLGAVLAGSLAAMRSPRLVAQDATPAASPAATPVAITTVILIDTQQRRVGAGTVTEAVDAQVTVSVTVEPGQLPPGRYGFVLHETGICEPSGVVPFSSAGGLDPNGPMKALGQIAVEQDRAIGFELRIEALAWEALKDRDGSALVVHAGGDDVADGLVDEVGRVACGVIYPPTETAAAASPVATHAAAPAATPVAAATAVTVEMVDIDFNPNELTIAANTDVTVRLPNLGATAHNFHIDPLDIHSEDVPPGAETTVAINAAAGDYEYYCSIPGHRQAGMVGTLHVE